MKKSMKFLSNSIRTFFKLSKNSFGIVGDLFRDDPIMTDGLRKTLENPEDREKIIHAIHSGDKKTVETSDGIYHIG